MVSAPILNQEQLMKVDVQLNHVARNIRAALLAGKRFEVIAEPKPLLECSLSSSGVIPSNAPSIYAGSITGPLVPVSVQLAPSQTRPFAASPLALACADCAGAASPLPPSASPAAGIATAWMADGQPSSV